MKFELALEQFKNEIEKEYGVREPIVKIGIKPDAMDAIISRMFQKEELISYRPCEFGEFMLNGVQLVPRTKDRF